MHTEFWSENLKERYQLGDLDVGGRRENNIKMDIKQTEAVIAPSV
jgi:hypothetical protein